MKLKQQTEEAIAQVAPADYSRKLGPEANSIAELLKHLAGNFRSRWTNFLTSDGDKPDRDRDSEFVLTPTDTPESLRQAWDASWKIFSSEYDQLTDADLNRMVTIRGEPHVVSRAILRSLTHAAGHVGQIVLLAKYYAGDNWKTLSIPRGQSKPYHAAMQKRYAGGETLGDT